MILKAFSRIFLVSAAFAGLLVPATVGAQTREASSSGVLLDRVAATVNEGVVLASELDEEMFLVTERLRAQRLELPPHKWRRPV